MPHEHLKELKMLAQNIMQMNVISRKILQKELYKQKKERSRRRIYRQV